MDKMKDMGILDDTVILLFGDHGWSRGENNEVGEERGGHDSK